MKIPKKIVNFLKSQSFVIVSTLDKNDLIHNSCKGIVAIEEEGIIYLLDLYQGYTYKNLKNRPYLSITAVDEDRFEGYCLKGKAELVEKNGLRPKIIKLWEDNITKRITNRIIKSLQGQKKHSGHPEASLPKPRYLIKMKVERIVDLSRL